MVLIIWPWETSQLILRPSKTRTCSITTSTTTWPKRPMLVLYKKRMHKISWILRHTSMAITLLAPSIIAHRTPKESVDPSGQAAMQKIWPTSPSQTRMYMALRCPKRAKTMTSNSWMITSGKSHSVHHTKNAVRKESPAYLLVPGIAQLSIKQLTWIWTESFCTRGVILSRLPIATLSLRYRRAMMGHSLSRPMISSPMPLFWCTWDQRKPKRRLYSSRMTSKLWLRLFK